MKDIKSTENKKRAYLERVGSCSSANSPKAVKAMDLDKLSLFYKKKTPYYSH